MPDGARVSGVTQAMTQLGTRLQQMESRLGVVAAGALVRELEGVLTQSKAIVPLDTGLLQGTGKVYPPQISAGQTSVAIGYGEGGAEAYALEQHENLVFSHGAGRSAKYLETPLTTWTKGGPQRVAQLVMKALP